MTPRTQFAPASGSQTLDRGLRLLDLLAVADRPMTLDEVAKESAMHRSVAYRLLRTLQHHEYVKLTSNGYVLWSGGFHLGSHFLRILREAVRPELAKLAGQVGVSAFLAVRDGDVALTVDSVEVYSTRTGGIYRPQLSHPLTLGAPGIALLSGGPPLAGERSEVTIARRRGFAASRDEVVQGLGTIAAPIAPVTYGGVAAIAVIYAAERFGKDEAVALLNAARSVGAHIRRTLGPGVVPPGLSS